MFKQEGGRNKRASDQACREVRHRGIDHGRKRAAKKFEKSIKRVSTEYRCANTTCHKFQKSVKIVSKECQSRTRRSNKCSKSVKRGSMTKTTSQECQKSVKCQKSFKRVSMWNDTSSRVSNECHNYVKKCEPKSRTANKCKKSFTRGVNGRRQPLKGVRREIRFK